MAYVEFVYCEKHDELTQVNKEFNYNCTHCGANLDGIEFTDNHTLHRVSTLANLNSKHIMEKFVLGAMTEVHANPNKYRIPWTTDLEVTFLTQCNQLMAKAFPDENRYPLTLCYDALRTYRHNSSRSDIAKLDIPDDDKAAVAIYYTFTHYPEEMIRKLSATELVVLQNIVARASHFISEFGAQSIDWAAYETH